MFIWSSIAHFIALTSPGPDTAIIIRQVTLHGRKSGFIAALGIGFGISVHCFLAISGISLFILSRFPRFGALAPEVGLQRFQNGKTRWRLTPRAKCPAHGAAVCHSNILCA